MPQAVELDIKKMVKKSNVLNEMRQSNMTMIEYRLFCIYLAHFSIDNNTNELVFKLNDYAAITNLSGLKKRDLERQAENLIRTAVKLANDKGGFSVYSVFKRFDLEQGENGWQVRLAINEDLLPFIKEQSGRFIRYKLYNTIFLKSFNQQRIYELLKQYEKLAERTIELKDLREYLSIKKDEYPVWYDFSSKVLKVSQKAIAENTDIKFEYEGIRHGRKVGAVKFTIYKNEAYKDRLQLAGWLPKDIIDKSYNGSEFAVDPHEDSYAEYRKYLSLPDEFTVAQLSEIVELIKLTEWYDKSKPVTEVELYTYLAAQDRYTVAHSPNNYRNYLRDAVKGNYAGIAVCDKSGTLESSFDTDEFFNAALEHARRISEKM